jgi:hypothetical protein
MLETGENLIERAQSAGQQAVRVSILRRAGARSRGRRQPVALQDVDLFEVLGQGAGRRQVADPGSDDDGALTQLMRTIRPLLSKRQSVFDQPCPFSTPQGAVARIPSCARRAIWGEAGGRS